MRVTGGKTRQAILVLDEVLNPNGTAERLAIFDVNGQPLVTVGEEGPAGPPGSPGSGGGGGSSILWAGEWEAVDYPATTVVRHNNGLWIATSDVVFSDEPVGALVEEPLGDAASSYGPYPYDGQLGLGLSPDILLDDTAQAMGFRSTYGRVHKIVVTTAGTFNFQGRPGTGAASGIDLYGYLVNEAGTTLSSDDNSGSGTEEDPFNLYPLFSDRALDVGIYSLFMVTKFADPPAFGNYKWDISTTDGGVLEELGSGWELMLQSIDPVGLHWEGAWAEQVYLANSVVKHNNSLWLASEEITDLSEPGIVPSDTEFAFQGYDYDNTYLHTRLTRSNQNWSAGSTQADEAHFVIDVETAGTLTLDKSALGSMRIYRANGTLLAHAGGNDYTTSFTVGTWFVRIMAMDTPPETGTLRVIEGTGVIDEGPSLIAPWELMVEGVA